MTSPDAARDALTTAVMALHAAVDGWAAAVMAAADAHPGSPDDAVEEPALGAAEDAWDDALDAFHDAAADVLGVHDDEDDDEVLDDLLTAGDPAEAVGVQLYATVVGAGDGDPLLLVDGAGEKVVEALEAAGYEVPEWGVSIVPVQDLSAQGTDDDGADDESTGEDA